MVEKWTIEKPDKLVNWYLIAPYGETSWPVGEREFYAQSICDLLNGLTAQLAKAKAEILETEVLHYGLGFDHGADYGGHLAKAENARLSKELTEAKAEIEIEKRIGKESADAFILSESINARYREALGEIKVVYKRPEFKELTGCNFYGVVASKAVKIAATALNEGK